MKTSDYINALREMIATKNAQIQVLLDTIKGRDTTIGLLELEIKRLRNLQ